MQREQTNAGGDDLVCNAKSRPKPFRRPARKPKGAAPDLSPLVGRTNHAAPKPKRVAGGLAPSADDGLYFAAIPARDQCDDGGRSGQAENVGLDQIAAVVATECNRGGSSGNASIGQIVIVAPIAPEGKCGGRNAIASVGPEDGTAVLSAIRALHRECNIAMMQRMRLDGALGAFIRTELGWTKDAPEKHRKAIERQALEILNGKVESQWDDIVEANIHGRRPFELHERELKKQISKLVEGLPIWQQFAKAIRGLGAYSLGVIISEAGDIRAYRNRNNLWKRMGVGVVDGLRQGSPGTGATADDWIRHGYNRKRRSRMWNIGAGLIKQNDGRYRQVYDARKEFEKTRQPDIRPIVAHLRAQRYMEQRLLSDLMREWRRL